MSDKTILITQDRDNLVKLARLVEDRCPGANHQHALNADLWELVFRRVDDLLESESKLYRIKFTQKQEENA